MNGKHCPTCGRDISEWECLCIICWESVKIHDAMYGTKNLEIFLSGKSPDLTEDIKFDQVVKWIKSKKIAMIREVSTEFCRRCSHPEKEGNTSNGCFECKYKKIFDYLMSELV